ncbi:MAG: amphi-Trp domain-containing protein [Gammaproteobacteria bacterium]|jgi:amphi-Trp domain-containing protein|nr:amphi-Trp domain-containing protein [Gammaproteobacteria bacterium]
MKRKKNSFRHESLQNRDSIQAILEALSEGIAKGKVSFSDDDDSISMVPDGLLNLKLSVSQEDNRNRINLRITWEDRQKKALKKSRLSVRAK